MTTAPADNSSAELVSGFIAVLSMVASALAVFYQPVKVAPFAIFLALLATGLGARNARLPLIAVLVAVVGFFAGMTIAVATGHRLY